jgi:predicted membrane protein
MSKIRNTNSNRAFTGLLLVLIGAALLLRNMNFLFIPEWLFTWPMILVVIGLYMGIKNGFRNVSWLILVGLGGFFLVDEFIPSLTKEAFFWPVIIMAMGIIFILRPKREHWRNCRKDGQDADSTSSEENPYGKSGFKIMSSDKTDDSDDYLHISSIFSGVNRKILSKNFQGGSINCIFGGTEVDMTQAEIKNKIVIRIDQVFGGIKLKVPPDWIVQNNINGVFHGVDEKRNPQSFAADPSKVLVLQGSSIFAGIEIRSY